MINQPDKENIQRILGNIQYLLENGLFPGSSAPATIEALQLLQTMIKDLSPAEPSSGDAP